MTMDDALPFPSPTIEVMRVQEATRYATADYLGDRTMKSTCGVTVTCRKALATWLVNLCHYCKYSQETAEHALNLVDRFMLTSRGSKVLESKSQFQLATIAALYVAAKIFELEALTPTTLAMLSNDGYTPEDIEMMEAELLDALEWRVNVPTVFAFIRETVRLIPETIFDKTVKRVLLELANTQAELAIGDYNVSVKKSVLAFAAVSNSCEDLGITLNLMQLLRSSVLIIDPQDLISLHCVKQHLRSSDPASSVATYHLKPLKSSKGYHPNSPRSVQAPEL